jgi:two-component system response regulator FixJ
MADCKAMNRINATLQNPLIAIVDDDASIRISTRRLVNVFGYGTETFSSAREFLTASRSTDFACLILDLRMPGMDGLELQRLLSLQHRHTPQIIFVSARRSNDGLTEAMGTGAVEFLPKPVDAQALSIAITKALRRDFYRERKPWPVANA